MSAVLGIDAAWTEHNESGFALVEKADRAWRLTAAGSNIAEFACACGLDAAEGAGPGFALACARNALDGSLPDLVAVDMPLSRKEIVGRTESDMAISRGFGAAKCATHSPLPNRPGEIGRRLQRACEAEGYRLKTATGGLRPPFLAEVYPHPALLRLMGVPERVKYKVVKTKKYWPDAKPDERLSLVRSNPRRIAERLDEVIAGVQDAVDLERPDGFSALKPVEDTLDAIVSAWVGITILENAAEPFGDDDSAIWVPTETWANIR